MSDIKWHYFPEEKPNYGDLILWLHWQAINKPPDVIIFDRETEWIDGDRWAKINDEPKRNPLPDGTLELTEEELREFEKLFGLEGFKSIYIEDDEIRLELETYDPYTLTDYKAILWLADRFNLEAKSE